MRRFACPLALSVVCCFAALAPAANANIVSPASVALPIRVPSMNNFSIGTASLLVSFTDTDATATVTAPTVRLGIGNVFQIDTCVKAHAIRASLDTKCAQRIVDTRAASAVVTVAAPIVTEPLARPASGGSAYFSYIVTLSERQSDGSYKRIGSSWPDAGLSRASVPVPSVGAATGSAPVSEGAALSSGTTGGINNGLPDSMCDSVVNTDVSPPGDGVSTTGLGADAPAYYEIGEPSGAYAGQPPKGVMLVIHGGGWYAVGPGQVAATRGEADRWRARGWRTLNITYGPCTAGFHDVQWFYDQARQLWGSSVPYCALGQSAGGNLALMLAASRPSLACVVDEAGPTDGTTLPSQKTANPSATAASNGPRWLYNLLTAAVGRENVPWWSPAGFRIHARVVFAVAANDWYVPYAQGTELRSRMLARDPSAYADVMQLASGTTKWVHGSVSPAALQSFYDAEDRLVAPLVS